MKYQFATIGIDLGKNNVIGFNIVNLLLQRIWFAPVTEPLGTGEKFSTNDLSVGVTYLQCLQTDFQ